MKNLMVTDPELVIGLVGRLGVDTKNVSKLVSEQLRALHYDSVTIKITDYLKTKKFEIDVKDQKIEERYESYIDACNHIREKANRNDFFVSYAIQLLGKLILSIKLNDQKRRKLSEKFMANNLY
jgi:hypothetical protein